MAGGPRIVVNPKVFGDERDALCVAYNEAFRVIMEANGFDPQSEPTAAQREFFADTDYADDETMLRRTILARICTFDTSVRDPTDEQLQEAVEFLDTVMEIGAPQNAEEQRNVQRIRDVLAATAGSSGTGEPSGPEAQGAGTRAAAGAGQAEDDLTKRIRFGSGNRSGVHVGNRELTGAEAQKLFDRYDAGLQVNDIQREAIEDFLARNGGMNNQQQQQAAGRQDAPDPSSLVDRNYKFGSGRTSGMTDGKRELTGAEAQNMLDRYTSGASMNDSQRQMVERFFADLAKKEEQNAQAGQPPPAVAVKAPAAGAGAAAAGNGGPKVAKAEAPEAPKTSTVGDEGNGAESSYASNPEVEEEKVRG